MFTIAGARKKLQAEHREGPKPAPAPSSAPKPVLHDNVEAPTLFVTGFEPENTVSAWRSEGDSNEVYTRDQRDALKTVAAHLLELREMLKSSQIS